MPPRRPVKRLFTNLATTCFFLAVLLLSAGRFNYWQGWIYAAVGLFMSFATQLILSDNPDLLKERSRPGAGAKVWDKNLLGLGLFLTLATLVVAGLNSGRYHWPPNLSWMWFIPGLILSLVGMSIFLLALKENRFFSAVVRIQTDRNQTVCKTGVYKIVRHPGNAGMIIGTIGLPFLFLSAWSAIPVLFSIGILVIRTHLEDNLLKEELEGYADYQHSTHFRLIPGIW
jgi:protein-S-isoprenylcysteine O-methyltransferase Ste14